MRVIVTRPGPQAGQWVHALQAAGHDAMALPLIEIGPTSHPQAVVAAWNALALFDAVMFVSANAAAHFFAMQPEGLRASEQAAKPRMWATGPGTVAALVAQGIAPSQIDAPDAAAAQLDTEALWQVVQAHVQPGWRVLIVRGTTNAMHGADAATGVGRDWLAERLLQRAATVEFVVAYERRAPVFSANALVLAQVAAADGSVWLFSSSEAVSNLCAAAAGVHWGRARAVATHARIANAAREAGFGVVCASRPALSSIIASIESLP
jgi:uroporphyrinogen-III synthase